MKTLLLFTIIYGLMGFILDYSVRQFEISGSFLDRLKNCRQLINILVYSTGGSLLYLILLIPVFRQLSFLPLLIFIGSVVLTSVELVWGYLLNIKLKWNIWDYSHSRIKILGKLIPLNFKGQIDLTHFIIWGLLSIPVFYIQNILLWLVK